MQEQLLNLLAGSVLASFVASSRSVVCFDVSKLSTRFVRGFIKVCSCVSVVLMLYMYSVEQNCWCVFSLSCSLRNLDVSIESMYFISLITMKLLPAYQPKCY